MKKKKVSSKNVERTTLGLRTVLFDQIDGLRAGTVTAQESNAIARAAGSIIETVQLEMDYQRLALKLTKKGLRAVGTEVLVLGSKI